jgi:anti-anti-sigma factor
VSPLTAIGEADPRERDAPDGADPLFRLIVRSRGKGILLVLQGELDVATTPELETSLVAPSGRRVVVDLREVSFADATALRALLRAEARSRQNGRNLAFIAGDAVQRLMDVLGLQDALTFIAPPGG